MKKRLEAELISIAHRVLKLKNKAEIDQLYIETRKLYEVLAVLKFVDENIDIVQPKIDVVEIEQKLENVLEQENDEEPIPVLENKVFDDLSNETESEVKKDFGAIETVEAEIEVAPEAPELFVAKKLEPAVLPLFVPEVELPVFERKIPEVLEKEIADEKTVTDNIGFDFEKNEAPIAFEKPNQPAMQQISFEELLGHQISEPVFEKKQDITPTLNDKLSKNTTFGLNDKIGFVKHLFDNSDEDFNRVVSQIGTFDSLLEAQIFLNELVKPDYNNWKNKEDYEKRFMEIIERKFL